MIDAERAVAEAELREQVGVLATELAGKIVGESMTDYARQSGVVDRYLEELRTAKASDAAAGEARD